MTLTLWRGVELLGELLLEQMRGADLSDPDKPSLGAFLMRRPGAKPSPALTQYSTPLHPGAIHQHRLDRESTRGALAEASHSDQVTTLRLLTPEEVAGVPPELQLTIRDETGRTYLPTQLLVQPHPFMSPEDGSKLRGSAQKAFADGELWMVIARFASLDEAPADPLAF